MVASSRYARDVYGFSPVLVQQFNRDIANPLRLKGQDITPNLEDFKDSGDTTDAADVVLGLFDPWRYKVGDSVGYSLDDLRGPIIENGRKTDRTGKFYRSLHILKNSFDSDGIRMGMAYHPVYGIFKSMPQEDAAQMRGEEYESILNNSYFLQ